MSADKVGCCTKYRHLKIESDKKARVLAIAIKALKEIKTPESEKALEEMRKIYRGIC